MELYRKTSLQKQRKKSFYNIGNLEKNKHCFLRGFAHLGPKGGKKPCSPPPFVFHVYFHEKPNTNFLPGCLKN